MNDNGGSATRPFATAGPVEERGGAGRGHVTEAAEEPLVPDERPRVDVSHSFETVVVNTLPIPGGARQEKFGVGFQRRRLR